MYEKEISALKVDGKGIDKILSMNNEVSFGEIEDYIKKHDFQLYLEIQVII